MKTSLNFRATALTVGCLVAGLLVMARPGHGNDALTIITEDYPPLNFVEQGKLSGPAVEIVLAIQKRLGNTDEIKVYPWARGYNFLETKPNTLLFSTTRSEAREKLFKWVGPLAEKKIGFFAKKNRAIKLQNVEDARDYLIGVQKGGVGIQYLKDWGLMKFDASTKPEANLKKLMNGRNDLWLASNATVAGNTKKLKIDINELEQVLVIQNTFMSIAINKNTPDTLVNLWQQAFDELVKEGTVKKILQKHGLENLYPSFQ